MGVPALFRWLSKKYPKIISRVVEDAPKRVRGENGEMVEVPLDYDSENPNGFEVDNLYLDMNGIVHPCTHPEGKPAPETEAEMMVEVFKYTERVVNMARPRKVLFMAIDGVAPRAKMNQQRSRRFRSAQEAAEKEEERKESIRLFEAMGHPVSEETKNKKAWDSNAITPGTPFMDLLSASLKYWVSQKLTNDPGWKHLKIIISDASVPGEGEHKIVDWIRRQRSYPEWDANTSHAIYGLDADLIMLALATHEPNFRVLREDVFFQGNKGPMTCHNCGKPGHITANCKSPKKIKDPNVVEVAKPVDPKPFIWLDVCCLREYLRVELDIPNTGFPYDPELAIDDWIFMIFFVGNDFLPHLPSLEIRENAIDVLLNIWRRELPNMGGYLTNHGKVNMARCQYILDGIAAQEDGIFQKRKQDEERQAERQKRRRREDHNRQDQEAKREAKAAGKDTRGSMQMNGTDYEQVVVRADSARGGANHPSLPQRPAFDIVPKAEAAKPVVGKPGKKLTYAQQAASLKAGLEAMSGSNLDVVKNRKAIRMANMSAAEKLKAELEGNGAAEGDKAERMEEETTEVKEEDDGAADEGDVSMDVEGLPHGKKRKHDSDEEVPSQGKKRKDDEEGDEDDEGEDEDEDKDEDEDEDDEENADDVDDDAPVNPDDAHVPKKKLKINPDGTVDYEDTVRLWEPGYRKRYYNQKFGVELPDDDFVSKITRSYMEGLCWVLEYYYQGVPAWDWFYPYHYAPFAQDFSNVGSLKIEFPPSRPFTPFGQLLGVFPAASRIHLPPALQTLMVDEDSPILDFYPSDFDIDMNGKKMAWQGVALLPFIDQKRLLAALDSKLDELTDDEKRRNKWGDNVMFVADENDLTVFFSRTLYGVKPATKQVPLDTKLSHGVSGSVLPDPNCVPHARLETPIPSIPECPDLETNNSLSVRYYFPRQAHRHRSVILPGYRNLPSKLNEGDRSRIRRGDFGDGGGGGGRGRRRDGPGGGPGMAHPSGRPQRDRPNAYSGQPTYPSAPPRNPYGSGGAGGYGGSGYGAPPPRNPYGAPPPTAAYGGGAYGGGSYGGGGYGGSGYGGGYGGAGDGAGSGGNYGRAPAQSAYGAPPPSYGRPPPGYGAGGYPPAGGYGGAASGGYGGYGGSGGSGGRGGYNGNAYSGRGRQPPRY